MQGSLPAPEESLNGQFHTGFCFRGLNKSVLSPTSYELIKKLVGFVAAVSVERVRNRLALLTTGGKRAGVLLGFSRPGVCQKSLLEAHASPWVTQGR